MNEKTNITALISRVEEHIGLLQSLKLENIHEVESIDSALSGLLLDINSRCLPAEDGESMEMLNEVFGRLDRVGRIKAKRYGLIYNKPKAAVAKKGKRKIIRVMVMEGATITKEPPSSTNKSKEVTSKTKILLRVDESTSTTGSKTGVATTTSTNITGSRKEIAYNSLREAADWFDNMAGGYTPMPKLIINDSVAGAAQAIMEGKRGFRKLCTAGVFDRRAPDELHVSAYLYPKADLPGFTAHEFAHYVNNRATNSDEARRNFFHADEKLRSTPVKDLPPIQEHFSPNNFMNTYLTECPAVFFAAAFECREFGGDKNLAQSKYTMPHLILDRMASHWECNRKEVVDYARRLHNEISINVPRKQIELALEDASSILAARKLRGNAETGEELKSFDKEIGKIADKSDTKAVYGIRAPAIAMLLYAGNNFDLKATTKELVSSSPLEIILKIKNTQQSAVNSLDRLL